VLEKFCAVKEGATRKPSARSRSIVNLFILMNVFDGNS